MKLMQSVAHCQECFTPTSWFRYEDNNLSRNLRCNRLSQVAWECDIERCSLLTSSL